VCLSRELFRRHIRRSINHNKIQTIGSWGYRELCYKIDAGRTATMFYSSLSIHNSCPRPLTPPLVTGYNSYIWCLKIAQPTLTYCKTHKHVGFDAVRCKRLVQIKEFTQITAKYHLISLLFEPTSSSKAWTQFGSNHCGCNAALLHLVACQYNNKQQNERRWRGGGGGF